MRSESPAEGGNQGGERGRIINGGGLGYWGTGKRIRVGGWVARGSPRKSKRKA